MLRTSTLLAIGVLMASTAASQLDPTRSVTYHQGSPGIRGVLEADHFGSAFAQGDFNGDGRPDLAVGSPFETVDGVEKVGAIHVFYGDPAGFNVDDPDDQVFTQATPGIASVPEANDRWGSALAAGDFDRDGFDDLAVGASGESVGAESFAGAVTVLYGSAAGLQTGGAQTFHQDSTDEDGNTMPGTAELSDGFGWVLATGDFNGDRYQDLAIGIPGEHVALVAGGDHGAVQILYGTAQGLRISKSAINGSGYLHQNKPASTAALEDEAFGRVLVVADFDGDRRDDLAVGIPRDSDLVDLAGAVNVFYGATTGLQPVDEVAVFSSIGDCGGDPFDLLGLSLAAGDFDGDGHSDLAVRGRDGAGDELCFLYGSSAGLGQGFAPAKRTARIAVPTSDLFGNGLVAGDFDDDGDSELALYVDGDAFLESGRILLGDGGPSGIVTSEHSLAQGEGGIPGTPSLLDHFGHFMLAGDVTGDGVADLVAGAHRDEISGVDDAGSLTIIPGTRPTIQTCIPGPNELCLRDRFRVTLEWQTDSDSGIGKPVDQGSEDSGMFWFFEPDNWEMLVKVLDGCVINGRFWVYAAPTTDVGYRLTLIDEATGETKVYENALGQPAQALADVDAFSSACAVVSGRQTEPVQSVLRTTALQPVLAADPPTGPTLVESTDAIGTCISSSNTMCLVDERFELTVEGFTPASPIGQTFEGSVAPAGTLNSGIFWFFDPDNWEMLVKVLDGCAITGHWWVYAAAATDVAYTLDVRDTVTGMTARYINPLGQLAPAETDVFALPCN